MDYSAYLVPLLLACTALFGVGRRVNVFDALAQGAEEGLTILLRILPNLVGLMTAVYMLRASGVLDLLGQLLACSSSARSAAAGPWPSAASS